jgi:uncharacterized membrane protein
VRARASDNSTAGWGVATIGALLVVAGVLVASYSWRTHTLYRALTKVAGHVMTTLPAFLTQAWVDKWAWVASLIGVVLVAAGVALIIMRRRVATHAATATARSRAWMTGLPGRVRSVPRVELAVLGAIVVAGVVVRVIVLNDPMRYDETFTYQEFASHPLRVVLSSFPNQNNHVLNTLLAHYSTSLFGSDPWAIRLPAFIVGCLLIPATYFAGRALYSGGTGLIAAGLVAVSSPLIEYSANARGYSYGALAFVILLVLGRAMSLRPNVLAAVPFAVVAALGIWAVPTTALALGTVALWVVAESWLRHRRAALRVILPLIGASVAALLIAVVLYAPILLVGAAGLTNNSDYTTDLGAVVGDVARHWTRDMPVVVILVLSIGLVVALIRHRRVADVRVPPIAAAVPVVLLALAAGRLVQYPRTWLFLLPLALITAAAGVEYVVAQVVGIRRPVPTWLPAATAVVLAGVVLIGGATSAIRSENEGRDAPALTSWLGTTLKMHGGHVVTITPFNYILRYYFPRARLTTDYVLDGVDPASAKLHLLIVVPAGKTLEQMTGTQKISKVEGARFEPVPGLEQEVGRSARLVRRFPTARVYASG